MALVTACWISSLAAASASRAAGEPADPAVPVARWSFDEMRGGTVVDSLHGIAGTIDGKPVQTEGVEGRALKLDGESVVVRSEPSLCFGGAAFTVSVWVNPHALGYGQQMIVSKNRYPHQREWGLMLDKDDLFRFYFRKSGWKTLGATTSPQPGSWYHVAVTVENGVGRIYVNGKLEGEGELGTSLAVTDAPLTMGAAAQEAGFMSQKFVGAIDEVRLFRGALAPDAIRAMADRPTRPHQIEVAEPVRIWGGGTLPKSDEIPVLKGVEFHVIKRDEPDVDGGKWLLGVALAWHGDQLYSSYGFNTGAENTASEEAQGRVSSDGGRTWGKVFGIASGDANTGASSGVFLSHSGTLWAFHPSFEGHAERVYTCAYALDTATGTWKPKGTVVDGGFWPMQEPQRMEDGNWIMAGTRVARGYAGLVTNPPAVAISHGEDFTRWDLVTLPIHPSMPASSVWGESAVIVRGAEVLIISRWNKAKMAAVASTSSDYGRTWTPVKATNLPMAASKPYCGILSTGQGYLICTTTADSGNRRSPLTIALTRPGEKQFSRLFVIRHAIHPTGPGPSHADATLCYPYAVEHQGKLYVGYAVKSDRTAELAVIPLESLK